LFAADGATVAVDVLLALTVLLSAARVGAWVAVRVGQPKVMGEIVAGIVLGPSVLGLVWPTALDTVFDPPVIGALKVLAQIGLVLFMFLVGLEVNLVHLRGSGRQALVVSNVSILLPLVLGGVLALWLYPRYGGDANQVAFTLFIGTAMAITAFPVLARVLQDSGLATTRIGVLALTCAAIDDVTAWCLLSVVVALVHASGPERVFVTFGLLVAFGSALILLVRPLLRRLPRFTVPAALVLAFSSAWLTEQIGVHTIFGAFLAGLIAPRASAEHLRSSLETMTTLVLLPVFFLVVGLSTRIDLLTSPLLWGVALIVTAVAVAGKFAGSTLASRLLGESWRDAILLGTLLNMRGLTELVILTVGLEIGLISPTLYTVMVVMALVTTAMAAPLIARFRSTA
jgi:Kef-type K+ transport system membrane component KefB